MQYLESDAPAAMTMKCGLGLHVRSCHKGRREGAEPVGGPLRKGQNVHSRAR
jgi:hypothetical protein